MKSSSNRIIRGAAVEGVILCGPNGHTEEENVERQELENLRALESFWYQKGFQEGQKKGFDEGWREGEQEGLRKGTFEGKRLGKEEGMAEGHSAGLQEGSEKAQEELGAALGQTRNLIESLTETKEKLFEQLKPEIVRFAIAIAEQLLCQELTQQRVLVSVLERLLEQAKPIIQSETVNIILAPSDLALLDKALDALRYDRKEIKKVNFSSDASATPGSFRIETALGLLSFDIQRLSKELEAHLLSFQSDDNAP